MSLSPPQATFPRNFLTIFPISFLAFLSPIDRLLQPLLHLLLIPHLWINPFLQKFGAQVKIVLGVLVAELARARPHVTVNAIQLDSLATVPQMLHDLW